MFNNICSDYTKVNFHKWNWYRPLTLNSGGVILAKRDTNSLMTNIGVYFKIMITYVRPLFYLRTSFIDSVIKSNVFVCFQYTYVRKHSKGKRSYIIPLYYLSYLLPATTYTVFYWVIVCYKRSHSFIPPYLILISSFVSFLVFMRFGFPTSD